MFRSCFSKVAIGYHPISPGPLPRAPTPSRRRSAAREGRPRGTSRRTWGARDPVIIGCRSARAVTTTGGRQRANVVYVWGVKHGIKAIYLDRIERYDNIVYKRYHF